MPDLYARSRSVPPDSFNDIRAYPDGADSGGAITGTGDLTAPVGAISVASLETFTGTGSEVAPAGAISVASLEIFTGTGSEVAPAGAISVASLETFTGSGDLTAPAGAISVASLETFTGTGSVVAPVGAISGSALETFIGTGSEIAPVGAISGSVLETFTGTGSEVAPAGAISVASLETFTASGDITAPVGAISDSTATAITGTGDISASAGGEDGIGDVSALIVTGVGPGSGYVRYKDDRAIYKNGHVRYGKIEEAKVDQKRIGGYARISALVGFSSGSGKAVPLAITGSCEVISTSRIESSGLLKIDGSGSSRSIISKIQSVGNRVHAPIIGSIDVTASVTILDGRAKFGVSGTSSIDADAGTIDSIGQQTIILEDQVRIEGIGNATADTGLIDSIGQRIHKSIIGTMNINSKFTKLDGRGELEDDEDLLLLLEVA